MVGVVKKIFLKEVGKENFPNPSHGRVVVGGGGIIYVKILLKKSVCLVLALGWRENINKKNI